jgi:hypothetical protein
MTYVCHYVVARLVYDGIAGTGIPPLALLAVLSAAIFVWQRRRP